jgi:hypothetical protein
VTLKEKFWVKKKRKNILNLIKTKIYFLIFNFQFFLVWDYIKVGQPFFAYKTANNIMIT